MASLAGCVTSASFMMNQKRLICGWKEEEQDWGKKKHMKPQAGREEKDEGRAVVSYAGALRAWSMAWVTQQMERGRRTVVGRSPWPVGVARSS